MFWRRRDDDPMTPEERLHEQLSAYLDGELSDEERAAVEARLERDEAARETLEDLRLIRSAFGALSDVRAPRSFAIRAPAASSEPAGPLMMFRRAETFVRASAAVAALLFVVALVNDPTGTTPTASAPDVAMQAAGDAAGGGAEGGAAGAAQLAPAGVEGAPAPELTPAAEGTPEGEAASALAAADDGEPATADADGAQDAQGAGVMTAEEARQDEAEQRSEGALPERAGGGLESAASAEQLQPMPAGTEPGAAASEGVGGMAPALATLAALLAALAVLMARTRRSGDSTR